MAKFSANYKQSGPTVRFTAGENSYEKGMYYSDSVLNSGYSRMLFNLEVDSLNYSLKVAKGFCVDSVAVGSKYLEYETFGDSISSQVIISQPRNQFCLKLTEGVNNVISVQKVPVPSNQVLEEAIRKEGFLAPDVMCFKVLVFNPINYRLLSLTMLVLGRDRHFAVSDDYSLRRIECNPVSTGIAIYWNDDFQANEGKTDFYIPRVRRNTHTETYGQVLHSPHRMQTIAHCEGFGNKTFMFTARKTTGFDKDKYELKNPMRAKVIKIKSTTSGFADYPEYHLLYLRDSKSIKPIKILAGGYFTVDDDGYRVYDSSDPVGSLSVLDKGLFDFSDAKDLTREYTSDLFEYEHNPEYEEGSKYILTDLIIEFESCSEPVEMPVDYFSYIDKCHTNVIGGTDSSCRIGYTKDKTSKTENFQETEYSKIYEVTTTTEVLTEYYFYKIRSTETITVTTKPKAFEVNPDDIGVDVSKEVTEDVLEGPIEEILYGDLRTAYAFVPKHIDPSGSIDPPVLENSIESLKGYTDFYDNKVEIDLDTGGLNIVSGAWKFKSLTPNIEGAHKFSTKFPINPDWTYHSGWVNPGDFFENTGSIFRGQAFRFVVYATPAKPMTRELNRFAGLDADLYKKYYIEPEASAYLLNYMWDGEHWQFSFLDCANGLGIDGIINYNNELRGTFKEKQLSYLDIITEDNIDDMAKHDVDLLEDCSYDLTKTVSDTNNSKFHDASYGHFDLVPKVLTPNEATSGYNMLSDAPYVFKCDRKPLFDPIITGVLMMKDGLPMINPTINSAGELHIYFSADPDILTGDVYSEEDGTLATPGTQYQLKLEQKNSYDTWQRLATLSVDDTIGSLKSLQPFKIPYIGAEESPIIRVELVDLDPDKVIKIPTSDGKIIEDYFVVTSTLVNLNFTKESTQAELSLKNYDLGSALGMTYWKSRLVVWGVKDASDMLFTSEPGVPEYFPYPNGADIFDEKIIHIVPYSDALVVFTATKIWRIDMNADGLSWRKTLLQQNIRMEDNDIPYICVVKSMLFFKAGTQFYMLVPARGAVAGELTIAPISKPISELLRDPFSVIKECLDIEDKDSPFESYIVKYGAHVEQNKVFVDWWFDIQAFEKSSPHIGSFDMETDVGNNPEFLLVQLIYDTQAYCWSMRSHSTNSIGGFLSDAANAETDYVSLVKTCDSWGLQVLKRGGVSDEVFESFDFNPSEEKEGLLDVFFGSISSEKVEPSYVRKQVFDTGYKEVSNPSLEKRFREVQIFFEPKESNAKVTEQPDGEYSDVIANSEYMKKLLGGSDLLAEYMREETDVGPVVGTVEPMKITLEVSVDGNVIKPARHPKVDLSNKDNGAIDIKVGESFDLIYGAGAVDAELENSFELDSSALAGVKLVRFKRKVSGKGKQVRMLFKNHTESNYNITGHSFVASNKNGR